MSGFFDKVKGTYNSVKGNVSEKYNSAIKKKGEYTSRMSNYLGGKAKHYGGKVGEAGKHYGGKVGEAGRNAGGFVRYASKTKPGLVAEGALGGAGIIKGAEYAPQIEKAVSGVATAGGGKLSTAGQALKDLSIAVTIPTGFVPGVAIGVAGTELYERGGKKAIKKLMKTRKGAIAKEFGKKAGEEYETVVKEMDELEKKNKGFEKAYNKAAVEGLKGAPKLENIVEEYKQFKRENGEKYENLKGVVNEFNKQYNAVARGKSFDMPTIEVDANGNYSVEPMPLKEFIQSDLESVGTEYRNNMKEQQKAISELGSNTSTEDRQKSFDKLKELEKKAGKLREGLEMTYAQLNAEERREGKKQKKSK